MAHWTEQKVYYGAGDQVTTPDGYADPNGRMHDFGDKKYGLTGDSHGWRQDYVDWWPGGVYVYLVSVTYLCRSA